MLRKVSLAVLCLFAVVACDKTIDGVLTNSENLTFKIKNKPVTISAGKWASTIRFASKKEVKLEIEVPNEKKPVAISFKVPKSTPLPQENGEFELLAVQSGQPYDVKGSVNTTYVDSEEKWGWEGCTYQARRHECYYDYYGRPYCRWVYYNVHGQRDVRYYVRQATQNITFHFLTSTGSAAGTFNGVKRSSERVYTYTGICR
jgi:hypothetical protein